jgi:hypothetical protein
MTRAARNKPAIYSDEYGAQLLKYFSDTVRSSSSYGTQEPPYENMLHESTGKQPSHGEDPGNFIHLKHGNGGQDIEKAR